MLDLYGLGRPGITKMADFEEPSVSAFSGEEKSI